MSKVVRDWSKPYAMPNDGVGGLTPLAVGLLVLLLICVVVGGTIWLFEPEPACVPICQPKEITYGARAPN